MNSNKELNIKKETKGEYDKKYYRANKEKWTTYFDCECGGRYCYNTKSHHFKSKKHILNGQLKNIHNVEMKIESVKQNL